MTWWWLCVALADEPSVGGEVVLDQPVEPPVLVEQVPLHYPEEALGEEVHGDVQVLVHVDSDGRVLDVTFESGPAVFRAEAMRAARRLKFEPARQGGEAVPALTRVFFHFAPPDHQHPEPVFEIVVDGAGADALDTHARTTLEQEVLDQQGGDELAEAISAVAGVVSASGSADNAKPVIRGQPERRLLLIQDGVRHASQKWGVDHAPEIDPLSAGSISVIKGAAGVRYGADAIGGVILLERAPLRDEAGVDGKIWMVGSTNGRRGYMAGRLDVGTAGPWSMRVEGSGVRSASLSTPDYVLGNTASSGYSGGLVVEGRPGVSDVSLSWRRFQRTMGVFYGVQNSSAEELSGALDRPLLADSWKVDYAIDRPRQQVTHDVWAARASTPLGSVGELDVRYAFQLNQRQEFEQVRQAIEGPQYDFTLRTHSLDLDVRHHAHLLESAALEGGAGIVAAFQENVYRGLPLVPNYRSLSAGLYGFERITWDRVALEAGARADGLARTAFLTESAWERHLRNGLLEEDSCEDTGAAQACPGQWRAGSLSLGALWKVIPGMVEAKLDLSSASRFPSVDEEWIYGSAPSFPVYAVGQPGVGVETTWGASPTVGLSTPWLIAEASGYVNRTPRYIAFQPSLTGDGEVAREVTIRGTWPRYGYEVLPALFYGFDASTTIAPEAPMFLGLQASMVRGQDTRSGAHLVGVPADRFTSRMGAQGLALGPMKEPRASVDVHWVGRQARVDPARDLAPVPDAYLLLGAAVSSAVTLGSGRLRMTIEGRNLLNQRYRDYLGLLRYYADQPGRDLMVRLTLEN